MIPNRIKDMKQRKSTAFVTVRVALPFRKARNFATRKHAKSRHAQMNVGRTSLITGGCLLTGLLGNRLFLTPLDGLTATQSRADIVGVIAGATLVLYGLARAEVSERRASVEMGGVQVKAGFEDSKAEVVERCAQSLIDGIQGAKSVTVMVGGEGKFFLGRFRTAAPEARVVGEGIVAKAMDSGKRAYLADMKVVPVRETEFGFLPQKCQVC